MFPLKTELQFPNTFNTISKHQYLESFPDLLNFLIETHHKKDFQLHNQTINTINQIIGDVEDQLQIYLKNLVKKGISIQNQPSLDTLESICKQIGQYKKITQKKLLFIQDNEKRAVQYPIPATIKLMMRLAEKEQKIHNILQICKLTKIKPKKRSSTLIYENNKSNTISIISEIAL